MNRTRPHHRSRPTAVAALAAFLVLAASVQPASAADQYTPDSGPQVTVNGTYRPLVGNFSGDVRDDILWYAPGSTPEQMWLGTGNPSQPFVKVAGPSVNGTYTPLVGNFGGDDTWDEILWYAPGSAPDSLWQNPAGYFDPKPVSVNGTFEPIVLENGGSWDSIFWYAKGSAPDFLWQFQNQLPAQSSAQSVNGTFKPFTLNQDGDGYDDIFWYAPGTAPDALWLRVGSTTFSRHAQTVNGTYTPLVGDWSAVADGAEDVLWSNLAGGDSLNISGANGTFSGFALGVPNRTAVVVESVGKDMAYFYGGNGPDQNWRVETDGSYVLEDQVGYNASQVATAFTGFFSGTSSGSLFFYRPGPGAELYLR